jgi:hypothetical protein
MTDIYVSEKGSGAKSGSSFDNAMAFASLNTAIKAAGPGGHVYLLADAGTYQVKAPINIWSGGAAGAPVTISGAAYDGSARAVEITGTRASTYTANMAAGNELFKFLGGGHLVFENMHIVNTGTPFRVGTDYKNLTIRNVDADNVRRFFEDYASGSNKTATITGLTIEDVEVRGFSKGVVRLQYDSSGIVINNVHGDSQRQDGDDFAIGVHLEGTVHDVKITNSMMENISDTVGSAYWNGDGFATERQVRDVTFENVISRGNTDSGFDLKSVDTVLINTIAEDNKRNYRFWGEATMIDAQALDPHSRGGSGSQAQIQVSKGGVLHIIGGSIKDAGSKTFVFDNDGTIDVQGAQIIRAIDARPYAGKRVDYGSMQIVSSEGAFSSSYEAVTPPIAGPEIPAPTPDPEPEPAAPPAEPQPIATEQPAQTQPEPSPPVAEPTPVASEPPMKAPPEPAFPPAPITQAPAKHFSVSVSSTPMKQKLAGFDSASVLMLNDPLYDSNKDGIIKLSGNKLLNLSKVHTVDLGPAKSLRYLGETEDGHAYAPIVSRPRDVVESRVTDDWLSAAPKDSKADRFFFDTALNLDLGHDTVRNFGAKDVIITTTRLAVGADGMVHAGDAGFALHDGYFGLDDRAQVFARDGSEVETLQLLRTSPYGEVTWYVYGGVFENGLL